MKLLYITKEQSRSRWIILGFLLLCLAGGIDYFTGTEISFSLFYVFPIALIAWAGGWKLGVFSSVIGAALWLGAEFFAGANYTYPIILYWNTTVRLCIFLLVPFLIKLGQELTQEATIARTDFVTGAFNSRYFHERLQIEIDRSIRYSHPLTIAYLDVDNFKNIKDRFGHSMGDKILNAIARNLVQTLRKTDVVSRMGGDEFALLLPEADVNAAQAAVSKARKNLLEAMRKSDWPVTISVGVVTFTNAPPSVDFALDMADKIMYEVKANGKDNIAYVAHQ
jgi:diguanylate cyclase (GGDEF)-like protein